MTDRHPDVVTFDRAVAEHELRELAGAGRDAGAADGDHCADCGTPLDALNRHQVVEVGEGLGSTLTFVCREHYFARLNA